VHGWDDLGMKLHQLSKQGRWQEMAKEVPDDVVRTFAAVGTYGELAKAVEGSLLPAGVGGRSQLINLLPQGAAS